MVLAISRAALQIRRKRFPIRRVTAKQERLKSIYYWQLGLGLGMVLGIARVGVRRRV